MIVVLDEEAERRLFRSAEAHHGSGPALATQVTATLNVEEDRIVICGKDGEALWFSSSDGVALPCFTSKGTNPPDSSGHGLSSPFPLLLIDVVEDSGPSLRANFYSSDSTLPQVCQTEVVRWETDLFSRVRGIFDTRVLAPKTVAVIGLGSGGALGALELAKAGVGNFILVDFDRLKAHNIIRHVCGMADIGRFKTLAVRDAILRHNPLTSVECHQVDITADGSLLEQIAASADLVFVATDNQLSRYLINDACLYSGTPAVYGGAYERAFAGEVVRVVPGEAGCYACVRQGLANTMRSISSQQEFDYTDDEDLVAEPGLGLDVSFIGLIHAKVALLTLLRGTSSTLEDIDADMIIWTNSARPQDGELFQRPLVRHLVKVAKFPDCPACGLDEEWDLESAGATEDSEDTA